MGRMGCTCLASQVSGHGWEVHFPNSEENCRVLEGSCQDSTQHQGDLCSQSHYGQRGAKEGKLATKHEVVWESGHGCCENPRRSQQALLQSSRRGSPLALTTSSSAGQPPGNPHSRQRFTRDLNLHTPNSTTYPVLPSSLQARTFLRPHLSTAHASTSKLY